MTRIHFATFASLLLLASASAQCPHEWDSSWSGTGNITADVLIADTFPRSIKNIDQAGSNLTYLAGAPELGGLLLSGVGSYDGRTFAAVGNADPARKGPMARFDDGNGEKLYIVNSPNLTTSFVERLDGGQSFTTVGTPIPMLRSIKVLDDGQGPRLYAIGDVGAQNPTGILVWSGTQWNAVGPGPAPTGPYSTISVLDIEMHDDGGGADLCALYLNLQYIGLSPFYDNSVYRLEPSGWSILGGVSPGQNLKKLAVYDWGQSPRLLVGCNLHTIIYWNGTSFVLVPGTTGSGTAAVNDMVVMNDGTGDKLYVAGTNAIVAANPTATRGLAAWDGTNWSAVGPGLTGTGGSSLAGDVVVVDLDVATTAGGQVLDLCGRFAADSNGLVLNKMARWDGTSFRRLGGRGANGSIYAMTEYDGGNGTELIAAGLFGKIGGIQASSIAKFDGTNWTPLGSGFTLNSPNCFALTTFNDGTGNALYAAGSFGQAGSVSARAIAKWNGTSWSALGTGLTGLFQIPNAAAYALEVFDDGTGPALYVGGSFMFAGGLPAAGLAKWNGTQWTSVGGFSGTVYALEAAVVNGAPRLFVGGSFATVGGMTANGFASWNGASWTTYGTGMTKNGAAGVVRAITKKVENAATVLYLGGDFTDAGPTPAMNIARFDGSNFSALGSGAGPVGPASVVKALVAYDEGQGTVLYAGGSANEFGGVPSGRIARWDGSSWSTLGAGVLAPSAGATEVDAFHVSTLPNIPGLMVGGVFSMADGQPSFGLGQWRPSTIAPICSSLPEPAASGYVGAAFGAPEQVFMVNGSTGGAAHRVNVALNAPIVLQMNQPTLTPYTGSFTLFGYGGVADASTIVGLPFGLGEISFPFCPLDPGNPALITVADGLGIPGCAAFLPAGPLPWTYAHTPGLPFPYAFTLQGVVSDATAPFGFSITNAILVVVN